MSRYFHITPFGSKSTQEGASIDFAKVQRELVEPATTAAGLSGGTTGIVLDAGSIHEDMFQLIVESDTVICDVTLHNANVWYELGIRHALSRKNTILIKANPADDTPFDILTYRYVRYSAADPARAVDDLARSISQSVKSDRETDSPVFKMLPKLKAPDPEQIQAVPTDFSEEVERAKTANSVGWLRLLSDEVMGLRFQRPGLRLVGAAQLDVKDYEGARETWSKVREQIDNDVEANLALANVLERLHRKNHDPVTLTESDQAIQRALESSSLSDNQRAEALAFLGRNLKTRWRQGFRDEPDLAERRRIATNRLLKESYKAYRDAFMIDLNHFWSGLAALQMNTIARDLAKDPAWETAFLDSQKELEEFQNEYRELTPVVAQGIRNALARKPKRKGDDWADVSAADLGFIEGTHEDYLKNLYRYAIVGDGIKRDGFKRDAALGQLKLFDVLGVREQAAQAIIKELEDISIEAETERERCVVVVAGHQIDEEIDEAHRPACRFPAAAEINARARIAEQLREIASAGAELSVFASGASGTDLLCHEVCNELDLKSTICLPIPPNSFAEKCYKGLGEWRNRFVRLANRDGDRVRVLSRSGKGLPNWLHDKEQDPWRRGNRWVVEMAKATPAKRHVLIVLWDGIRDEGGGGTSDVVALAEKRGFEIVTIATQSLSRADPGRP